MTEVNPNLSEAQILFESRRLDDLSIDNVASYRIPALLKKNHHCWR
ncbi:hypothetical protein ACTQ54_00840 [Fundicoccus sp. Sow4_H7]